MAKKFMLIVSSTLLILFIILLVVFNKTNFNNAKITLHDQAESLAKPLTDMENYIQIHTKDIQLSGSREDDGSIQIFQGQVGVPGTLFNPDYYPDEFELEALKYFQENEAATSYEDLVEINGQQVYRYLEPVRLNEACIKCHGQPVTPTEDWPYDIGELEIGDLKGAITIMVPADVVLNNVKNDNITLLVGSFLIIIALLIIIYFTIRKTIVKPVQQTVNHMQNIANGDISEKTTTIQAQHEIGELVKASEQMKNQLRQLILQVKNSAEQVASSALQFTENCQHTSQTGEEISQFITNMAQSIAHQSNKTNQITETTLNSRKYIEDSTEQTKKLSMRSKDTHSIALKGKEYIQNTVNQINVIENTVKQLSEVISNLSERSDAITSIVHLISEISEQTNLLALNAAIEASRAGEQGKGFAVVAEEVRKLAEQSAESANNITELINKIQEDIQVVVTKMKFGLEEVNKGKDLAYIAENSFVHILDSINKIVEEIEAVTDKSITISEQTNQIFLDLQMVSTLSEKVNSDSSEATIKVSEQKENIELINLASKQLMSLSDELLEAVKKFNL